MPIRLIAIDLDGTLLTRERVPHPDNIDAIRRAQAAGIQVVLASGRAVGSIRDFSKRLGIEGAMICSNGGHVIGQDGAELLFCGLTPEVVEIALAYVAESDVHAVAYSRDKVYFLKESEWGNLYRSRVKNIDPDTATPDQVRQLSVLKVLLIDHPDAIQLRKGHLQSRLNGSAILTESEPEYLEILSAEVDKAHGLSILTQTLGIHQQETAAIGDYLNDLGMIRWAGMGGAVGNALDEVKAVADVVMPTNEEAGVARFIDHILASQ